MNKEKITHPSFGMISVSHFRSTGEQVLYGSTLKHNKGVSIHINKSSMNDGFPASYNEENTILEISLTEAQFAELVSGSGFRRVPCTFKCLNGELIEEPPFFPQRSLAEKKLESNINTISERLGSLMKETEELMAKKSLTKKDRESILSKMDMLNMEVSKNLPFLQHQFHALLESISDENRILNLEQENENEN